MTSALSLAIRPYRLPFRQPFTTASGSQLVREGYLLRLSAEDGLSGYGEAAPLPGHGGGAPDAVVPALRRLAEALAEHVDQEGISADRDAWRAVMARLRALAPDAPAACAGIDLALADLAARRAGLPLAHWLNPRARRAVPVNATIGADDLDLAARQAREAVAAGYRSLKLKLIGADPLQDLTRIAVVRDAAGAGVALRLDVNGAWDEAKALAVIPALAEYAIEYVEQPVPARELDRDVASLARVRAASPVPVAADEALLLPGGVEAVLSAGAADVLILKPMLLGGLARVWDLAETLRGAAGTVGPRNPPGPEDLVVTTALDSAVGRLGALHLSAALPGLTRACGLATGGLLAEDVAATPEARSGAMEIEPAPGLGVEILGGWGRGEGGWRG